MRMGSFGLSVDGMDRYGERNLEPGAAAWIRFDGQLAAEEPDALLDDHRTLPRVLLLGRRQPACKRKSTPVVVDRQAADAVGHGQPHEDVARTAVFADVDERLLND